MSRAWCPWSAGKALFGLELLDMIHTIDKIGTEQAKGGNAEAMAGWPAGDDGGGMGGVKGVSG